MRKHLFGVFLAMSLLSPMIVMAHEQPQPAVKIVKTYKAKVSWYKYGHKTANGEVFNPNKYTVAHRTLPFGTLVRLTNIDTNVKVIVRVNDRGPFIKGREFDMTVKCAYVLGVKKNGVSTLKIEILG